MSTERIYETDGGAVSFEARVTGCRECANGFEITLDRTAFFPGGGGQEPDNGALDGKPVLSLYETGGEIVHVLSSPLAAGARVRGELDRETRLRRMQNHGGEHIISGIVNRLYGLNNVGFHMGSDDITVDFDGVLDRERLVEAERLANLAVAENRRITVSTPPPDVLATLNYRSKKPLEGRVRIVEIEGFDRCACCAPHLPSTGSVGMIKILDFIHYKGGVRVHLLCGLDALDDYHRRYCADAELSALLSAKQSGLTDAVRRLYDECGALRGECGELRRRLMQYRADAVPPTDGNICLFEDTDPNTARYLVKLCLDKCGGICAVFSGDDSIGYKFIMASRTRDLCAALPELSRALSARGGGSPAMIQGTAGAAGQVIREFFGNRSD